MSYLDPYGGDTEPHGWERPDEAPGYERAAAQPGYPATQPGYERPAAAPPDGPRSGGGGLPPRGHGRPDPAEYAPQRGEPSLRPGQPYRGKPPTRTGQPYPGEPVGHPGQPYPGEPAVHPGQPDPGRDQPYPGSEDDYARPGGPFGEAPPYPQRSDQGPAGDLDMATSPVGWPQVDPPAPPAGRRGPGRRRASRSRPPTQPASTGRAGRNLPAAIGVGVGLGALVVIPLFLLRPAFLAVVAAAVAVGIWEMVRAVRASGAQPPLVPLVAGGLLMTGLAWWAGPDALSLGLLVTVLAAMVWRLGDGPAGFQRDLTATALIAVYVPFLGGFAVLLAVAPDGDLRVLVTLAAVVLSDTGGYAAGVAFGKHPMAPSVSPKKSWEGFGGSVLAAALGSALLLWLLLDVAPWWGALFGLAVAGAAVLGDLGESMIKRDLGIKDMSNLLPGHGGLMDRLDSVLFAVPTAYLLLAIFAPAG